MLTPVQKATELIRHAVAWNVEGANVPPYSFQEMYRDLENLVEEERELFSEAVSVAGVVLEVSPDGDVKTFYQEDSDEYYKNRFL